RFSRQGCRRYTRRLALQGSALVIPRRFSCEPLCPLGSSFFSFRLGQVCRWISAQIGFQEILGFRQRNAIVALALDLKTQLCAAALQEMPATCAVGRYEV